MKTKNIFLAIVCSGLSCACSIAPSSADNLAPSNSSCKAPAAVLGTATGVVLGTPIAAARMSARDMKAVFNAYDGDSFSWKFWGRPLALPVGVIEGTVKGLIADPRNAFRYAREKPFSKDALSLGDLK